MCRAKIHHGFRRGDGFLIQFKSGIFGAGAIFEKPERCKEFRVATAFTARLPKQTAGALEALRILPGICNPGPGESQFAGPGFAQEQLQLTLAAWLRIGGIAPDGMVCKRGMKRIRGRA